MSIKAADVNALRKKTGAGMMDCKKALVETNGDFDAAVDVIRKKGQAIANKRSDRETHEGCTLAGVSGGYAAIVALNCETDFVAKNDNFVAFTQSVLDLALATKPENKEALLAAQLDGRVLSEVITEQIGVVGEKIELSHFSSLEDADLQAYIHPGNKLAAIVAFNQAGVAEDVKKNVTMQVAAMDPIALNRDSVSQDVIDKELTIARDKAREEGKPEQMLDKIAEGRLVKFFKESTLMEQAFIVDNKVSIEQYLKGIDSNLTVTAFSRFSLS